MSGVKYLVVERAATPDERVVAELDALDEAILHVLIQYSEYERCWRGVKICREEHGRRSYEV